MQILMMMTALAGLASGATVRLAPGPQPFVEIRGQTFDPPVTIVADGADVAGVRIWDSKGIIWRGGTIRAPGGRDAPAPNNRGVDIIRSHGVDFSGVTFTDAKGGFLASDSDGIIVRNSHFLRIRSDGIDLAGTSRVLIEGNNFEDFRPVRSTGVRGQPNFVDGDHPDAVQIWATRVQPAVSDIVVRNNLIRGDLQGINTFGPSGNGHRRIAVENNRIMISYPPGVSVWNCTNCRVRFNTVETIPGSRFRANSSFNGSTGQFCANRITDVPRNVGNLPC